MSSALPWRLRTLLARSIGGAAAGAALLCAIGCQERDWDCAKLAPSEDALETVGSFRVHYIGGIGELDAKDMQMFVQTQTEDSLYLSGCVNDEDGMWDVDVVSSAPPDLELPAPFGSQSDAPKLTVNLYRYYEGDGSQSALFDDENLAEVTGTLDAFDTTLGELDLAAMLDKPCHGDCATKRSHVDIEARLTW